MYMGLKCARSQKRDSSVFEVSVLFAVSPEFNARPQHETTLPPQVSAQGLVYFLPSF